MLPGGCGVEQDGAAELWGAAWALAWDLFPTFFSWRCQHVSTQQIQDRPRPLQVQEKTTLFDLLLCRCQNQGESEVE